MAGPEALPWMQKPAGNALRRASPILAVRGAAGGSAAVVGTGAPGVPARIITRAVVAAAQAIAAQRVVDRVLALFAGAVRDGDVRDHGALFRVRRNGGERLDAQLVHFQLQLVHGASSVQGVTWEG